VSHRRQALESTLKDCGWEKCGNIWKNETFCIPQRTIDRLTAHEIPPAGPELAKILHFAANDPIIKNTIETLNRGYSVLPNGSDPKCKLVKIHN
jgi:hypothetical protein